MCSYVGLEIERHLCRPTPRDHVVVRRVHVVTGEEYIVAICSELTAGLPSPWQWLECGIALRGVPLTKCSYNIQVLLPWFSPTACHACFPYSVL